MMMYPALEEMYYDEGEDYYEDGPSSKVAHTYRWVRPGYSTYFYVVIVILCFQFLQVRQRTIKVHWSNAKMKSNDLRMK